MKKNLQNPNIILIFALRKMDKDMRMSEITEEIVAEVVVVTAIVGIIVAVVSLCGWLPC